MGAILLVRHGLASFGLGDYDRLSDEGRHQARTLGVALRERGVAPSLVVHGELRRQRETVDELLAGLAGIRPESATDGRPSGAGREARVGGPASPGAPGVGPERRVDPRWDEFDHAELLTRLRRRYRSQTVLAAEMAATGRPLRAFQETLEQALERWTSGAHDDEYVESFAAFAARSRAALDRVVTGAPPGTTVVVSSAGTISAVCAGLLGLPAGGWLGLNRVYANTGISKLVSGRRGLSLVSFNEHGHLPERPSRNAPDPRAIG